MAKLNWNKKPVREDYLWAGSDYKYRKRKAGLRKAGARYKPAPSYSNSTQNPWLGQPIDDRAKRELASYLKMDKVPHSLKEKIIDALEAARHNQCTNRRYWFLRKTVGRYVPDIYID